MIFSHMVSLLVILGVRLKHFKRNVRKILEFVNKTKIPS